MTDIVGMLLQILYVANIAIGFFIVFFEKRNPSVTWAWLMVIALVPYVGFVFYLIIGMDSRKHNAFAKKLKKDEKVMREIEKVWKHIPFQEAKERFKHAFRSPEKERLNDVINLHYTLGNHGLTTNNSMSMFHEGNSKYETLLKDIKNARKFIHMQYYIFRNGELACEVIAALTERAEAGVEVRLCVDGMGSMALPKKSYQPLLDAGGFVTVYLSPVHVRLNYHNHRKLCVIDGVIGYIGGFNIGDEYLGKDKRFGYWRDTHIRVVGDAVKDMEARFICDWNNCEKNVITEYAKYFPKIPDSKDGILMQIVSSGPDTRWTSVHYGYNKMVAEAEKSIYIETPYFVPDDSLLESLRLAALSGIDVRIIIPANPDHVLVYWASLSYLGELLKAGAKCYKYENGFIHSKIMMMDKLITSVGTTNMDMRSLKLNFEVNAFVYDSDITSAFENQFFRDLELCSEVTLEWYENRSKMIIIKESISRMLSPLL